MAEWVAGGLAQSLFMYNRENFFFDRTLHLKGQYQGQGMQIKQFSLYREDIRDLMNLTISKMDIYLLVSTLQLGFCIVILTEGRPKASRAPWCLLWLYAMTAMGAFFYFLLSAWLALHASIAAHSFGVRMLTQFVRLPVPSSSQIDAARSFAADYEALGVRDMLRIPVFRQQLDRLNSAVSASQDADGEAADAGGPASAMSKARRSLPQHIKLYRELQANWQAYDAYARVSMALGTNQMLYALAYTVEHMLSLLEFSLEPALACIIVCSAVAWLLARLDLYLSPRLLTLAGLLLVVPPALSLVSLAMLGHGPAIHFCGNLLMLLAYMLHIVWLIFIVYIARADKFGSLRLPRNFRSVLYLDVFGQMEAPRTRRQRAPSGEQANHTWPANQPWEDRMPGRLASFNRQHSMSGSSFCGLAGRPELRSELARLCRKLQAELERDLHRWEAAPLDELMPGASARVEIARLRAEFGEVVARLDSVAAGAGREEVKEQARAWLTLQWNLSGNCAEFFFCCDSGIIVWGRPREPDVILQLDGLKEQLRKLRNNEEALAEILSEDGMETEATQSRPQPLPPIASWTGAPSSSSTHEDELPPETRFGGNEALQGDAFQSAFGLAGESTAQSFHPHRSFVATTPQAVNPHPPILPGKLPWNSFFRGSVVLIIMWLVGLVWIFCRLTLRIDIPVDPPPRSPEVQVVIPSLDFNPVALSCSQSSKSIFITEKYAVYELLPESGDVRPVLEECLSAAPEFQSRGLLGLATECDDAMNCTALLLGSSGPEALRCSLGKNSREGPSRVQLFGGPWKGFVPSTRPGSLWARRGADGSLVMLQHSLGSTGKLVPHFEVGHAKSSQLHVLDDQGLVLGLQSSGLLQARPLGGNTAAAAAWRHLGFGRQWQGLCVLGEEVFLASSPTELQGRARAPAAIWRLPLAALMQGAQL